jgi:hypothetical protein
MNTIEWVVRPSGDCACYQCCWADGSPAMPIWIPEQWLDLTPFLAARFLLENGYPTQAELLVRLVGADRIMARAPLGALAATPLINFDTPVQEGTRELYRRVSR